MHQHSTRRINPKKLLLSKWTAITPENREKHFIVISVVLPELPDLQIEFIELEAIYLQRNFILPWCDLTDESLWIQGWQ